MMFGAEVKKGLTTIRVVGIIIFTHGEPHRPRPEAPSSPPDGHPQSATRPGEGRVVQRQRFLRSERCPAGEIRNAASRSPRRLHGEASRQGLWFFASVLLSGSGGVHPRWPGRAGAPETGTKTRSQVVAEGRGIRRADHRRRSQSGLGRRRTAEVRHLRTPTEHRAGVGAREKKTTLAEPRFSGWGYAQGAGPVSESRSSLAVWPAEEWPARVPRLLNPGVPFRLIVALYGCARRIPGGAGAIVATAKPGGQNEKCG